jgi:hypothetical protein
MELCCPGFFPAVEALLEAPGVVVLGTIPVKPIPQVRQGGTQSQRCTVAPPLHAAPSRATHSAPLSDPLLPAQVERLRARPDVAVVTISRANRDALVAEVADMVAARLGA